MGYDTTPAVGKREGSTVVSPATRPTTSFCAYYTIKFFCKQCSVMADESSVSLNHSDEKSKKKSLFFRGERLRMLPTFWKDFFLKKPLLFLPISSIMKLVINGYFFGQISAFLVRFSVG
jgi:hypothetical protein